MKKIFSIILSISILLGFTTSHALSNDVKIVLDGEELSSDVGAFIEDNRTFVPARAVFESLGVSVQWDGEYRTVMMLRKVDEEITSIALQIGLDKAFVNGEAISLENPPRILNNRTFVPLRFIIEELDEKITWVGEERTVYIETK